MRDRKQQLRMRRIDRRNLRMIDASLADWRARVRIAAVRELVAVPQISIDIAGEARLRKCEDDAQRNRDDDRNTQRHYGAAHDEPRCGGDRIRCNEAGKSEAIRDQRRRGRGSRE